MGGSGETPTARIVAEALAVPEGAVDADVVDSPVEVEAAGG